MTFSEKLIISLFALGSIFLFYFQDKQFRQTKKTYYICEDVETKKFLKPLKEEQYQELQSTYSDFNSMYFCQQKKYTSYHVSLMALGE